MRVRIRKGKGLSAPLAAGRRQLGLRVTRLLRVLSELGAEISLTLPDAPGTPDAPEGVIGAMAPTSSHAAKP